uniref:Uncharacterized protein n=1 Tax=Arundo donax TaxID=35708 RepID=A0A0A9GVD9_ARUDO
MEYNCILFTSKEKIVLTVAS